LGRLIEAGVTSFKIEGRAKSIYYQSLVSGAYRRALDLLISGDLVGFQKESKRLEKELSQKLVNRGFSTGFLLGGRGEEKIDSASEKSNWEFCGQVIPCDPVWKNNQGSIFIRVHNTIRSGDRVEIIRPGYDIIKMKIVKMHDASSNKELKEAHGGGGSRIIRLNIKGKDIPSGSVLARKKI
jgi:putative protease